MIAVGEESNNLENVLVTIADSYEARTSRSIDLMVALLEPILLVMMASIVAVIAVACFADPDDEQRRHSIGGSGAAVLLERTATGSSVADCGPRRTDGALARAC
jgi:hypothetical protein